MAQPDPPPREARVHVGAAGAAAELRSYFTSLAEDLEREDNAESSYTRGVRRMGTDGWLGIGWPPEYGARGALLFLAR